MFSTIVAELLHFVQHRHSTMCAGLKRNAQPFLFAIQRYRGGP